MKQFVCNTKIISGENALDALKTLNARKVMVVTDPFFMENGTAAAIAQRTGAAQISYFDKVAPDPSVTLAAEGTGALKAFQPDTLIALGGGSAMDCAKAMAYFSGTDATFVAIPTTSGSGSEVTDFAILTHNGVKHPLVDSRLRPDLAILEASLLEKLPKTLVADTGFDAISHALEAFVALDANAVTDALAKDAFATVLALLPASYGGNTAVRPQIHLASTMAGMAFTQAGLGLCHAIAHALGGAFHLPHGRLNAMLLPAVIECNAHAAADRYARIAAAAGLGGSAETIAVRNLKNALVRLRRELHLPDTLAQAGISPAVVRNRTKELVDAALADPCCATNPMKVEDFMVRRVLGAVAGHG
ncbi:MAG: iron-containing alcohol dehydrogenase [Oscillospiraceae bacterium]|nr:iron-containing alcohol dehydrogenase [Oscillospiraceae bacterium]